jgi:hypothetical protein
MLLNRTELLMPKQPTTQTRVPLPHVVKAASLAHDLFSPKEDPPPVGSMFTKASVSIPIGLLTAVDVIARRSGRSRSATLATLAECGYGLMVQQLSPTMRKALHEEVNAALPDLAGGAHAPADGTATFQAVEA